jgi:virginiamycin B lyase
MHEYKIPETNAQPVGVALDGRNRIWIADESNPGRIWLFNSTGRTFTREYLTPTTNSTPFYVLADKQSNIWFTELTGNRIGEIPSDGSAIKEYQLPTSDSGPSVLAFQNGTSYIWISEFYSNKIAKFDTVNQVFQEFILSPSPRSPLGIAVDPLGNVWIAEHGGSSVDQFTVSNSTLRKYPTSNASGNLTAPATVSIDDSGRVWFVEHVSNKVGRLDTRTDSADEFVFPTVGYSLQGFGSSLDSMGNFWFTLFSGNAIAMVENNATSLMQVKVTSNQMQTVTGGESITVSFQLSNLSQSPTVISLDTTSTLGTANQISISTRTVTLEGKQNATFAATVTPSTNTSPGSYTVGLVASSGNVSTIGIAFLNVQPSSLYLLESYIPEIAMVLIFGIVASIFLIIWRRKRRGYQHIAPKSNLPKITLLILSIVAIIFGINTVNTVEAKCPGLPPPPVGPNGTVGPDYFGVGLDIASVAFFSIVAYLLIRDRLKRRKPSTPPSGH